MNELNIIELVDIKPTPDVRHIYDKNMMEDKALIIDNGSYRCRAGWSFSTAPLLEFRNIIAKPRKDRKRENIESISTPSIQIGNAVNINMQLKTQFDRNIVTHFYNQEQIFDYLFSHLSIDSENNIPHPILMTEALGNPNFSRQQMNELLFELYGIPGVSYCNDALVSWQYKRSNTQDGLILSFGYHTTHVIPFLNGQAQLQHARRLNIGGYHMTTFFYRLMQMKYPVHVNAITISRAETLIHSHGFIAQDYRAELENWADQNYYLNHIKKIQLPFNPQAQNSNQTWEQKTEKRKEMAKRLFENNLKRAKERQLEDEEKLEFFQQIRQFHDDGDEENFQSALKDCGFSTLSDLNKNISIVQARLERMKQSSMSDNTPKEKSAVVKGPPSDLNLETWLVDINQKRENIIKKRQARRLRRQELGKRHTMAAQERMRIISNLARHDKGQDEFGKNDNDWDVYKIINRDNDSDSETENEKIMEYENILRHYDPNFQKPQLDNQFTAEKYQLHVGVEFMRAPEIVFQPGMIGKSEMGLIELIEFVLKQFKPDEQQRLVSCIFLTGGGGKIPGLKTRLNEEIRKIIPYEINFAIVETESPDVDAWYGCKEFSCTPEFKNTLLTRKEYEENGPGYFKVHKSSNQYWATPNAY